MSQTFRSLDTTPISLPRFRSPVSAFFPPLVLICGAYEKERIAGDRSGRGDCRSVGYHPGDHSVWEKSSARDRWGPAREAGFPWGRSHLCAWNFPALLYRIVGSGDLLRG